MRILHINSVCGVTGTGRIVTDLCNVAEAAGHSCVVAYGEHKYRNQSSCFLSIPIGNIWDCRVHGVLTRLFDIQGLGSRRATRLFLKELDRLDPDIVHLHNLHGYYLNYEMLFRHLKKRKQKVVWTLHDCWPMTGHCVYYQNIGCEKWQSQCNHCLQKKEYPASLFLDNSKDNYIRKKAAFTGLEHMVLLVPSQWLAKQVRKSFLRDYPVRVVPNGINKEVFHPVHGDFRKKYHLEGKFLILGVANVWSERKGLRFFGEMARRLDAQSQIVLVGLDEEQIRMLPEGVLGLPRTDAPEKLAEIYTTADVFVHPGREETFGLTVAEAMSCGTYSIVCENTACAEIISGTQNGSSNLENMQAGAIVSGSVESFLRAIEEYRAHMKQDTTDFECDLIDETQKIIRHAQQFSKERFGQDVLRVYEEIL